MSNPEWTPGPWKVHQMDNRAFQIEAFQGPGVCQTFGGIGEQEKANADLLASAPELYNALRPFGEIGKEVLASRERIRRGEGSSSFTLPGEWVEWCVLAVSALAKARGESQ